MTTIEIIKQSAKDCKIRAKPLAIVMLLAGVPLFWLKCQQDVFYPLSFSRLFLWPLGRLTGQEDYLLTWNLSHFVDSLLPILLDNFLIPLFVFLPVCIILKQSTDFHIRQGGRLWLHYAGRISLLGVFFTLARIAAIGVFIGLRHLFDVTASLTGILTVLAFTALMILLPFWIFLTVFAPIAAVQKERSAYHSIRYCARLLNKHIIRTLWGYFKLAFLFGIFLLPKDKLTLNPVSPTLKSTIFYVFYHVVLYPVQLKCYASYLDETLHFYLNGD